MSEIAPSIAIIERNSTIRPFIKKMADELATKSQQSPPIAVLLMHPLERPLLNDALERIGKRFYQKTNKPFMATLFVTDASDSALAEMTAHQGPLAIDVDDIIFKPNDWAKIEHVLTGECAHPYILLVSREDAGELVKDGHLSNGVRQKVCRSFFWPGPALRTASMKRDYFLHHLASKAPVAHEALANNSAARELLQEIFADKNRAFYIKDVLQCANAYAQHLENFTPEKHPVEVLAHFVTFVLDTDRESTPPAEDENVNAA